ncbi:hypothetical protein TG4357_00672 [Thalassovita gelatinovora]|uniref:Uncharacterized protein n=1 Tax=Thalassovita gelatinovora TaxID=53501 RepID=A0A0P1F6A8_THAGE|nr:hypothetical protein TG4357_00672 [Thalassovita gelatinovora]SEQ66967.1 hypothetical protein SAMN04488043_107175 [Thalassovita gelatinovora]
MKLNLKGGVTRSTGPWRRPPVIGFAIRVPRTAPKYDNHFNFIQSHEEKDGFPILVALASELSRGCVVFRVAPGWTLRASCTAYR